MDDAEYEHEYEVSGSSTEIAAAFETVADGLRAGSVRVGGDEDAVTVATPDELALEVELDRKDEEVSLELEVEWEADGEDAGISPVESSAAVGADESAAEVDDEDHAAEEDDDESSTGAGDDNSAGSGTDESTPTAVDDEVLPLGGERRPAEDAAPERIVAAPAGPQSLARFEVYEDRAAEWRWRLVHRNGNVIATGGEGYSRKHNALKGLRSVMQNAPGAEVTDDRSED